MNSMRSSKGCTFKMEYLRLTPGYRTALADGVLVPDSPKHMATEEFYRALPGSRLHLCETGYLFAVAVFSLQRDPSYIYRYAYQPEENWAVYTQNLTPQSYESEDYIFDQECWFRVCVRREDGADMGSEDYRRTEEMIGYYEAIQIPDTCNKPWFEQEIAETTAFIRRKDNLHTMKLCLLTDTHYTINGTWEDTVRNIRSVAENVKYDAIVHLGDFTDGMLPKRLTRKYVENMIRDLELCGTPLYITPGNHDCNYFRNRQNAFSVEEMRSLYRLGGRTTRSLGNGILQKDTENQILLKECTDQDRKEAYSGLDYFEDFPQFSLRLIFFSSFDDTAPIRYGYTDEQLQWLKEVLVSSVPGTKFLVFSHDAPLSKLDYWSFHIRNGERLLDILEECNASEAYQVVGFFYGHTHADYIFDECSFPVISTGCAKLEYFTDKKPQGAVAWPREADTVTQDLWDSVLIDFDRQRLKMVRFGAGEDREVSFAKKKSTYKDVAFLRRKNRTMKVWAHRGASGHAPENTLPAFELAHTLGADGIELDVQLTKDGVPVVIHDEWIDRVSDGMGCVRNYTLEELRNFNMNKNFPAYGKVIIPTLAEVYDLVRKTDMVINLELKNSVIFYEGLEEKVLRLAEEQGLAGRVIYSSFNHYSMRKIKRLLPGARVAFLYSNGILDIADYAERHGAYAVHPSVKNMEYPDVDIVRECHDRNIKVHVWTVNEEADFEKMRELGVDAVITNYVESGL